MMIFIFIDQSLEFMIPYLNGAIVVGGENPWTSWMKGNTLDTITLVIKFDDEVVGIIGVLLACNSW